MVAPPVAVLGSVKHRGAGVEHQKPQAFAARQLNRHLIGASGVQPLKIAGRVIFGRQIARQIGPEKSAEIADIRTNRQPRQHRNAPFTRKTAPTLGVARLTQLAVAVQIAPRRHPGVRP